MHFIFPIINLLDGENVIVDVNTFHVTYLLKCLRMANLELCGNIHSVNYKRSLRIFSHKYNIEHFLKEYKIQYLLH